MSDNEEFIREFLEECDENLDQLDKDLVTLEQNPRDNKRLESIFRTIHTIKGTSGFFSFSKLGALAHDGESLLGRLRDGELVLNQEIASTLLQLIDAIRQMLVNIRDTGSEGAGDYREVSANLIRCALSAGDEPVAEGEPLAAPQDAKALQDDVSALQDDGSAAPQEFSSAQADELAPRRAAEVTEGEPTPANVADTTDDLVTSGSEGSIRVDVRLLDELLDLAGELVLARNQLNQLVGDSLEDAALFKTIQRLSLITSELQEGVMQTRMQPISTIWRKYPRVIRDLSVACGKEIQLQQAGEHTELDRSLLEAIKDPLTHLIRNAVDHGIESPEVRQAQGKSPQGRVALRAYHEGGQVSIEITDDGAGINVERVKQRAFERGLIDQERAGALNDEELAQMIFRPGFSTAEQVTDVSGRGVGMDVVKTNIERIGGTITLQNRPGRGTTVRITIPLTLAIIPALIVASGGNRFAVPQVNLIELMSLDEASGRDSVEWIHDAPVCRLRGRLVPLVYLNQALELDDQPTPAAQSQSIVVLSTEGQRFGLVVDQVMNTEEIVVKPLGRALKAISAFAGATIMGDGTVALILDVVGLARKAGLAVAKSDLMPANDAVSDSQAASHSYLLCESHDGRRAAIRLADVERLEEFSAHQVERAAAAEAVQYGGEIMRLVRLAGLLSWPDESPDEKASLKVVVHRQRGRAAGLVVPRIVDIVRGPDEIEGSSSDKGGAVVGSLLIEERVTDVIDLAAAFRIAGIRFAEPVADSN